MDNLLASTPKKERKVKGRVEIDIQKCKGCELCRTACKEEVFQMSAGLNIKGYHYVIADNDQCTGCINCALVCPDAVITVYRTNPKKKKVDVTPPDIKEQLSRLAETTKP